MFSIDGQEIDLHNLSTLKGITINPGGFIEQHKDGVSTTITHHPWCAGLRKILTSDEPQLWQCNCKYSNIQTTKTN